MVSGAVCLSDGLGMIVSLLFCVPFTRFGLVALFVVLFGEAAIICQHFRDCIEQVDNVVVVQGDFAAILRN
jgi:hypothetical protein